MKKYKYQLHTHTTPCSDCGNMTPIELVDALEAEGYSGAVLTNHFYWGNTGIDRNLPWNDFVKAYEIDYKECKKAALNKDIDIIFGVEEHIEGGLEILVYGLTPEMLYKHPELKSHSIDDWSKLRDEYDILIIQAHPFRNRSYNRIIGVFPLELIDGIEVQNSGNTLENDLSAKEFANKHPDLILTSGADAHNPAHIPFGGLITQERIKDEKALVKVLKSKAFDLIDVR